jgi:archaea-specific DNA-binding protein
MDYARKQRDTLVLSKSIRGSGKLNLVDSPKLGTITEIIMSDMTDIASPADIEDGFEDGEEEPNMVRIGKKPIMNYVVACMTLLNTGVADVMVRGRGQSITKAVEVVEMLRRAFMKNIRIHSVDIGTEDVKREDGSTASLSMIEIIVGH